MNRNHSLALQSCKRLVLPFIAYKLFFFGVILLSQFLLPVFFSMEAYQRNFHFPEDAQPTRSCMYKTWDGQHYLYVSEFGYREGTMSTAFYPLWPFLIRAGSYLCGESHLIAGLILANLFSVLGALVFYYLVFVTLSPRQAEAAILLLLAYPGAIFFSFVYSESLFLLLSVLLFVFFHHHNLVGVSVCAFLLPLARPTGILILIPLAYWVFIEMRKDEKHNFLRFASLLAPLGGFLCYLLIMLLATGDAFEGFHAQKLYYANANAGRLLDPAGFLRSFLDAGFLHGMTGSMMDRLWFLIFLTTLYPLWRMDRTLFLFALTMGLVPAVTEWFISYTRYLSVVFPVFMVLGGWMGRDSCTAWRYTLLAGLFAVQILFLLMHINNYWVG